MTFCWRPTRRGSTRTRTLWFAVASFSVCFLCSTRSSAQDSQDNEDVGAAARQEKARKSTEAKPQSHVYTNDDLQKTQILTEQDRARMEAHKKSAPPPQTLEPAPSLDANGDSPAESLGEVARRYRREKVADAVEQSSRPKPPSPFPMDLSQPTFAAPAPVGPPLSSPRAPFAPIAPPAAASRPRLGRAPLRRDPFSRPAISPFLPAPSAGPAPLIAPVQPSPVVPSPEPAAPRRALKAPPAFATAPAKPPIVSPPPALRGIAPSKPSMTSPAAPSQPPVRPPSSVAPTSSSTARVTVQRGDSLWTLSQRFLGAGSHWQDWLSVNPGLLNPQLIQPGTVLIVPQRAPSATVGAPARVSVHRGDTLWTLALAHYGNGAAWQCIATANLALGDPSKIYPGQNLALPASCTLSHASKVPR